MFNRYGFAALFEGTASLPKTFDRLVAMYRDDPLFCIPPEIRDLGKGPDVKVVLLGTSDFAKSFAMAAEGRLDIACAVDDIKCRQGEKTFRDGIGIISSDDLTKLCRDDRRVLAVNTCRSDVARRHFNLLCAEHDIPALNFEQAIRFFGLGDTADHRVADWGPAIGRNCQEYLKVADGLSDGYSVDTFFSILCFHLSCDMEWCWNIAKPYASLYFRSGIFSMGEQESLIDCGASIGESTSSFIDATSGRFEKIWMVEPDRFNIETLRQFIGRLQGSGLDERLSLLPYAVGDASGEIAFEHMGGHRGSIVLGEGKANGVASLATLDELIDGSPTVIKMDIEGSEIPALRGARTIIGRHGPKLLISAYHRDDDFIRIPALISSIRDDYKIGMRHHTGDRWDTCLYFYR